MPESHTDTSGSCNFTLDISLHKEQRRFNEFGSFSDIGTNIHLIEVLLSLIFCDFFIVLEVFIIISIL